MRISALLAVLVLSGCYRETAEYDVRIYGQGTSLDQVLPEADDMSGLIELTRVRMWGTNLGMSMFGGTDAPRSDGLEFVYPYAAFGYPANSSWARGSLVLPPGGVVVDTPSCTTLIDVDFSPGPSSEYVDVGDQILLTAEDGSVTSLPRDPAVHPRPAGESWYVAYGAKPIPYYARDNPNFVPNWRPGQEVSVSFPGSVPAPEATIGSIPIPGEGTMRYPAELAGVLVNGEAVRAPHHGYDDDGVWVSDLLDDDVRFDGPWNGDGMTVEWDSLNNGDSITISIRYLSSGIETLCDGCTECADGFSCEPEDPDDDNSARYCTAAEGSSWLVAGDVSCTVPDTGEFTLTTKHLEMLDLYVPPYYVDGALLTVSRKAEGTIEVPDVRTFNGKRVKSSPVRTRATDLIITRLDAPPNLPGLDDDGNVIEE